VGYQQATSPAKTAPSALGSMWGNGHKTGDRTAGHSQMMLKRNLRIFIWSGEPPGTAASPAAVIATKDPTSH